MSRGVVRLVLVQDIINVSINEMSKLFRLCGRAGGIEQEDIQLGTEQGGYYDICQKSQLATFIIRVWLGLSKHFPTSISPRGDIRAQR